MELQWDSLVPGLFTINTSVGRISKDLTKSWVNLVDRWDCERMKANQATNPGEGEKEKVEEDEKQHTNQF